MSSAGRIKAGQAYVELTTDNSKLLRGLQAAQQMVYGFGQTLKSIGGDMMVLGGAMSLPMIQSIKTYASFDDSIRTLGAIANASGAQLEELKGYISKLGATTAFTHKQVADGAVNLARMGFSADELSHSLLPVMNLTRATGVSVDRLGEVSSYTAAIMRTFNIDASDLGDVCDVMAYAANRSAMDVFDLGEAMKIVAPSAYAVGENIRDVASSLMVMANAGVKGSLAGTSLRKVYQALAAQSGKTEGLSEAQLADGVRGIEQLTKMNIPITDKETGNLRKVSDILIDMADQVKRLKSGEKINFATDVFDLRGSLGALSILGNIPILKQFRQDLDSTGGYAKKTADDIEYGIGGSIRVILSQLEAIQIALGDAFFATFKEVLQNIPKVTSAIADFISQNKGAVGVAMLAAGGIFALGLAFTGLGITLKLVGMGLGIVYGLFKGLATIVLLPINGVVMLKNAIGSIYAAVLSLRPAVAVATGVFKGMFSIFSFGFQSSAAVAVGSVNIIRAILGNLGSIVQPAMLFVSSSFAMISKSFAVFVAALKTAGIVDAVAGIWAQTRVVLSGVIANIGASARALVSFVRILFAGVAGGIAASVNVVAVSVKGAFGFISTAFNIATMYIRGLKGVWLGTVAGFKTSIIVLKTMGMSAAGAMKSLSIGFYTILEASRRVVVTIRLLSQVFVYGLRALPALLDGITRGATLAFETIYQGMGFVVRGASAAFRQLTNFQSLTSGIVHGVVRLGSAIASSAVSLVNFAGSLRHGVGALTGMGKSLRLFWVTLNTSLIGPIFAVRVAFYRFVNLVKNSLYSLSALKGVLTASFSSLKSFKALLTVLFSSFKTIVASSLLAVRSAFSSLMVSMRGAMALFGSLRGAWTAFALVFSTGMKVVRTAALSFTGLVSLLKTTIASLGAFKSAWTAMQTSLLVSLEALKAGLVSLKLAFAGIELSPWLAIGGAIGVILWKSGELESAWDELKNLGSGLAVSFRQAGATIVDVFKDVSKAMEFGDTSLAWELGIQGFVLSVKTALKPIVAEFYRLKMIAKSVFIEIGGADVESDKGFWEGLFNFKEVKESKSIGDLFEKLRVASNISPEAIDNAHKENEELYSRELEELDTSLADTAQKYDETRKAVEWLQKFNERYSSVVEDVISNVADYDGEIKKYRNEATSRYAQSLADARSKNDAEYTMSLYNLQKKEVAEKRRVLNAIIGGLKAKKPELDENSQVFAQLRSVLFGEYGQAAMHLANLRKLADDQKMADKGAMSGSADPSKKQGGTSRIVATDIDSVVDFYDRFPKEAYGLQLDRRKREYGKFGDIISEVFPADLVKSMNSVAAQFPEEVLAPDKTFRSFYESITQALEASKLNYQMSLENALKDEKITKDEDRALRDQIFTISQAESIKDLFDGFFATAKENADKAVTKDIGAMTGNFSVESMKSMTVGRSFAEKTASNVQKITDKVKALDDIKKKLEEMYNDLVENSKVIVYEE